MFSMPEPIDLEEYAANDKEVPKSGPYKIRINKEKRDWPNPTITGRDILGLVNKTPPEKFAVYERLRGSKPARVELDQSVDLTRKGVERFETLPLEQTEGQ
jgi:hypothetical protein